jgi:outer membrane receptor protein involved in Fe transport
MKKQILISAFILISIAGISAQGLSDTIVIDEVVVTGSRIEVSRRNMPINVSVLNKADINEVEESGVLPVLSRKIPGLFVTERGVTGFGVGPNSAGQISIRGVGGAPNTQVLMLVDGQPQYMGIFGHPLPNSYVASDLERVEVIKGPGSILYGSNAMGGVVNFITKKQEQDGFSGNARIAYGTYNTQKYMVNGGLKKNGLQVFASLNRDVTDGHRDSSEFDITNAYVKAGYEFSPHIEVIADYNIAEFNSADPGRDFDTAPAFRADIMRGKTSFTLKNRFSGVEGAVHAFYNFGEHELSDGWRSNDENYGISAYQGITMPWNTLLTVGADLKKYGGKGSSGMAANKWNIENETGIYAIVRHEILKVLNLSYGLRIENNSQYGNELVPQGGISWNATEATTLKASVSKGFRSPTIMETYLFMPNPLLEPERMMNYEFSVSQHLLDGKFKADLSIFMLEGSNIIQLIPNDTPPPLVKRVNVGEFSNKGFELEINYFHSKVLTGALSYSYLSTKEPLLAAPAHQIYGGLNYRWNKFGFSFQANYVGGLYTYLHDPQTQSTSDDLLENYVLLNASLKYRPVKFAELFLSGKNLLDQQYQINNGYPMPGIHVMVGANFSF